MKICDNCQRILLDDMDVCRNCGGTEFTSLLFNTEIYNVEIDNDHE